MEEFEDIKVGDTTKTQLTTKKVKVVAIGRYTPNNKTGAETKDKVELEVKHPDRETTIKISKTKYEKDGTLKTAGLWITKDDQGKLARTSALAKTLEHYKCTTPKELIGKEVDTTTDEKGYLIVKAY